MQEIKLVAGELRIGTQTSCRAYFFFVSPTGMEMGINMCPHIMNKKYYSIPTEGDGRTFCTSFEVSQPIILKFVNLFSSFGKPRENYQIYIQLDETEPQIKFKGKDGFGEFIGRGKILFDRSKNIRESDLKKYFAFEVIAPSKDKKLKKGTVRKLIW